MKKSILLLLIIISLPLGTSRARPVPALDLSALTRNADQIVIGKVIAISETGRSALVIQQQSVPVIHKDVTLRVHRVLKGDSQPVLHFEMLVDQFGIFQPVTPNQFGMFFLHRKSMKEFVLVDPNFPFLVALPNSPPMEVAVFDRVVAELANVIVAGAAREKRIQAIETLKNVKSEKARAAFRQAAIVRDPSLRISALAALLRNNDSSFLGVAVDILLNPPPAYEKPLLTNLAVSITGITNPKSIPLLSRLLTARDVAPRRAAAYALRHVGGGGAIAPLSNALNDEDRDVRYQAVMGLAEISGDYQWGPSIDLFQRDEQLYLNHWKQWAKMR